MVLQYHLGVADTDVTSPLLTGLVHWRIFVLTDLCTRT